MKKTTETKSMVSVSPVMCCHIFCFQLWHNWCSLLPLCSSTNDQDVAERLKGLSFNLYTVQVTRYWLASFSQLKITKKRVAYAIKCHHWLKNEINHRAVGIFKKYPTSNVLLFKKGEFSGKTFQYWHWSHYVIDSKQLVTFKNRNLRLEFVTLY